MRKLGELFYINEKNIYGGVLIGYRKSGIYYLPVYKKPFNGICYKVVKKGKQLFIDPCTIKTMKLGEIRMFSALSDKEFLEVGDRLTAAQYYKPTNEYELIENRLTNCLMEKDKEPQRLLAEKLKREDEEKARENAIKYQGLEEEYQKLNSSINNQELAIEEKMLEFYQQNGISPEQMESDRQKIVSENIKYIRKLSQEKKERIERFIQQQDNEYDKAIIEYEKHQYDDILKKERDEASLMLGYYQQLNEEIDNQREEGCKRLLSFSAKK